MSDHAIELGPAEEAARLWESGRRLREEGDVIALLEAVDLGIRASEILAVHILYESRDRFPATIAALLDRPGRDIDVYRDAVAVPNTVGFTEVLDLLSDDALECVAPGMHRGWEDRRFSCRRSRETASEAVGYRIPPDDREALLLLSAYRNRVFRLPPPVRVVPEDVGAGLGPLDRLYAALRGHIVG